MRRGKGVRRELLDGGVVVEFCPTIRRILSKAKVAHCFSHVFGGDVEQDKRAVVRRFLADRSYLVNRDCVPAYRESDHPLETTANQLVLITDTVGDVKHARECGIRAVGVAWGMHSEEQLLAAGAEFVAIWPQELVAHLLPNGFAAACAVETPSTHGSRACRSEHDGAAACECNEDGAAGASELRRRRAIAAARQFSAQAEVSQIAESARESASPANLDAASPANLDAVLLKSLARLRARISSPADRAAQSV